MSARGSNLDSRRKRRRRIWRPRLAGVALDLGVGQSRRSNSSPIFSPNVQIRVPVYCMPGEIGLQRRSYSNMAPKYCVRNACRSFYPCTRLKQAKEKLHLSNGCHQSEICPVTGLSTHARRIFRRREPLGMLRKLSTAEQEKEGSAKKAISEMVYGSTCCLFVSYGTCRCRFMMPQETLTDNNINVIHCHLNYLSSSTATRLRVAVGSKTTNRAHFALQSK